ncbi:MAG: PD40 domain-containing protein, partial [Anaerolineales bacterium]|nr:PD40 domain-containing protein [Anaerolineales bacterium]
MVEYLTLPHRKLFLAILLLLPSIYSSNTAFGQQADFTVLTLNEAGEPADRWIYQPDISWNGEDAVWASPANNLVEDDQYDGSDIFIRDENGSISLVSVNSHGVQSNGWSFDPVISANGRYIAFSSLASNLQNKYSLPDTNGLADIYLHDRNRYTTERISVSTSGQQVTGWSEKPSISSDGRYIVYTSSARDIVAGDHNNANDIFLYDHLTKEVRIISRSSGSLAANGHSFNPSISSSGRYIAFLTYATNLSSDAKPGIFLYDQVDRNLIKIPIDINGSDLNQDLRISKPALSGNGTVLVFSTSDGTINSIYSYEHRDHKLESIFSSSAEQDNNKNPPPLDISDGGRFVVYPEKQLGGSQVLHVYDRVTAKTKEISLDHIIENNSMVMAVRMSPDGGHILIQSADSSSDNELHTKYALNHLYLIQNDIQDKITSQVYGWVSDGLGLPLAEVDILVGEERVSETNQYGDYAAAGILPGSQTLAPNKKGYVFEPQYFRISYANTMASPPESAVFSG